MAHIKKVQVGQTSYLIEPTLYITPSLSNGVYSSSLTDFALDAGVAIQVQFTDTNPADAQLKINDDTKYIYYNGNKIAASTFKTNHTYTLVYDGIQWQVVGDIDTDTIYTHPTGNGNNHIPSNGSSGQFLGWSANGTAAWVNNPNTDITVKQTSNTTDTNAHPLLASAQTSPTSGTAYETIYNANIKIIPSTGALYATKVYSGGNEVLTSFTETDPTVPSWAKTSSKPSYTASEVGALPSNTVVNKVKQTAKTDNVAYKLLLSAGGGTSISSGSDYEAVYYTGLTFNPNSKTLSINNGTNTGTLTATEYSGKAATAGNADTVNNLTVQTAVPANAVFTDTTYSAGTGLSLSDTTINHSNSVTEKTAYPSTATTASANGGTIIVRDIKYDAQGHITASTDRTITLSQTTYSTFVKSGSSAAAGLVPKPDTTAGTTKFLREDATWKTAVTSIKIETSSPLTGGSDTATTTTGIYTIEFSNQAHNTVLAGPSATDASDAAPTFRALVAADIPNLSAEKITSGSFAAARIPSLNASKITAGTFGVARGGTGQSSYTIGDILYASAATTLSKLAGNTTTTRKFLTSVAAEADTATAPSWEALTQDDIPIAAWAKADNKPSYTASEVGALASGTTVTNVSYTNTTNSDNEYPVLFKYSTSTTATAAGARFISATGKSVTINGKTGILTAAAGFKGDLDGKANSAGNADTVDSKSVSTTAPSSSSTDSVFPTSKAVWSAISNASGYGCTGTVTSITLKAGAGITLDTDNTAITSSGTRTISITNLDTTSGDTTKWLNQKGGWTTPTPSDIGAASDTHSHNYVTSIENLTGNLSLSDLGLSQALRFKGITSSTMSESFTGVPAGISDSYTPQIGDVVIDSNTDYEYVCIDATTGNSPTYTWESLGGDSSWALSTHTHGNITNEGCITTAITIGENDYLIVGDSSDSGKIGKGPIFSATVSSVTTSTKFLCQDGSWAIPKYYTHPTSNGNKHIPKNGSSGQFLKYSSAGTATWADLPTASTTAAGIIQIGTDATNALAGNTKVDGVKTTAVGSSNNIEYKILGSAGGASPTSESIYEAVYSTGVTFNPSTNTITATTFSGTLSGNAATATAANITTTDNSVAYYADDSGTFDSIASADGALYATEANGDLYWGTLPIAQGGTGVTSFTDDCVIVSTGTPQTLVSRGLKITGGTGDSTVTVTSYKTNSKLVIKPNGSGAIDLSAAAGAMTISTTTGALDIKTNSSTTSKGNITLKATGTKGTVSIESNGESVSISSGTSTSIDAATSISLTSGSSGAITITSGYSLSLFSGSSQDLSITSANDVILTNGSSNIAKLTGTAFQPGTDQSVDLGTSSIKWSKLYVGTAISYGDIYQPVYWNAGVPTEATEIIQEATFEFNTTNNGIVTIGHNTTPLNTSANSVVIQIVVDSGISYLESAISWNINSNNKIVLTATVTGTVTGYILYIK